MPVAHFATVKTIDPPLRSLAGQRFTAVGRRAKRLLFTAEDGNTLMVHLMSAGKLAVGAQAAEVGDARRARSSRAAT